MPNMPSSTALIHYAARAGDHNDRAMAATPYLAAALAAHLGVAPTTVGSPSPSDPSGWDAELAFALPAFKELATALDRALDAKRYPVTACSRCAPAIATLPVIARYHPDVLAVWFDAHADLNTPENSETAYLGGMALSGPLGMWDSGLGAGLKSAVLVGARDIDATETPVIDGERIRLIAPGANLVEDLKKAVAGHKVYVHLDCDVLSPGQMPTDYKVPDGLSLEQLGAAIAAIAQVAEVVGVEIGELETGETEEETKAKAKKLVETVSPLLVAQYGQQAQ
ncbi:Arginase/deacetylase [Cutaneotrichosporon oleaginosum]|uniref:Arginase/deacetylase n=1 Tax=Cutaneotrichosporon oleaginosum TaxID=879819 RepID=A0A0J0XDI7_9TREE|nr:Arginase/deacetylase [Cutaneotrichosporon oleaginosum]KLT39141.1 Arginase/deacetylase [Cutaneotrichosporon oleaginosum]TXT11324.1 hypothetical protein COLE_01734 [Cutaneotrichosporon oleaginosum]